MEFYLRYPDRPHLKVYERTLPTYEGHGFIAQSKYDGYNTMIVRDKSGTFCPKNQKRGSDGSYYFLSRRGQGKGGPADLPVSGDLVDQVEKLDLPDQTVLNAEWMARRTIGECPECMFVFDVLWWAGEWQGTRPYAGRFQMVEGILLEDDGDFSKGTLRRPRQTVVGFAEFFAKHKTIPYTEGIVLKKLDGTLVGSPQECADSPSMLRCKWRSGADGRDVWKP